MSLDTIDLVLSVEKEFGIELTNEVAARLIVVGDMYDYVVEQLRLRDEPLIESEIWERLRALIVEYLGVRPDQVTRDARFVQDLGID